MSYFDQHKATIMTAHPARMSIQQRRHWLPVALACLTLFGCGDDRPTTDADDNAYIIGGGLLTLDTRSASAHNVFATDHDGNRLSGAVVLRPGLSIIVDDGPPHAITASPGSLSVFDYDGDGRIDAGDPLWHSLHLAVDYDADGMIGADEYALIGECGVEALKLDAATDQLRSVHARGKEKMARTPAQR